MDMFLRRQWSNDYEAIVMADNYLRIIMLS